MRLTVMSFGFKFGLPPEADLVLDVRCLPNPFYVPELKHKTGLDQEVVDFVMSHHEAQELLHRYENFLQYALPLYVKEGKSQLTIAVGCTGGKHRSITFARKLAEYCTALGYEPGCSTGMPCAENRGTTMSFASSAREEIAQRSPTKECCVRAAAYGIACFAKYFDARGLVLQTEQPHTVQLAQQLFARCGIRGEILEKPRASGVLYEFNIRDAEQVTRLHELFGTTGRETSLQIDPGLIRCQTCVSAYIAMAFLCSGTVTDPQKEYNLEFLTSRTNLARDFEALLAEHEFAPHRTRRNGVNLIYVKTGANVERLLRFMGAADAATQISVLKAFKQVRNQTNRQTNCDTANLGKTARANAQTLKAIRYLQEQHALETLPEVLQQAAAKRLQYPDLSLTALCGCFDPAVSKSGLSHRMKKLEALAENLRQRQQEGQEAVQ